MYYFKMFMKYMYITHFELFTFLVFVFLYVVGLDDLICKNTSSCEYDISSQVLKSTVCYYTVVK